MICPRSWLYLTNGLLHYGNLLRLLQSFFELLKMMGGPGMSSSLQSFMKDGVQACVKNILAHIRVLAPSVPLEKLSEDTDDDNYLESIENAEFEVKDLANFIVEKLDIHLSPSNDEADS
jgi:hypothetical protein